MSDTGDADNMELDREADSSSVGENVLSHTSDVDATFRKRLCKPTVTVKVSGDC